MKLSGPSENPSEKTNDNASDLNATAALESLVRHPAIRPHLHKGVHVAADGSRWSRKRLEAYAKRVYQRHMVQSEVEREDYDVRPPQISVFPTIVGAP